MNIFGFPDYISEPDTVERGWECGYLYKSDMSQSHLGCGDVTKYLLGI